MQGAGMAVAIKIEQGLKQDQNDSAFPICQIEGPDLVLCNSVRLILK